MIQSAAVDGLIVFSMPKDDDSRRKGEASRARVRIPITTVFILERWLIVVHAGRSLAGLRLSTNPELPGGSPIVEFLEFGYLPSKCNSTEHPRTRHRLFFATDNGGNAFPS
jgi:hypothetical protein